MGRIASAEGNKRVGLAQQKNNLILREGLANAGESFATLRTGNAVGISV